MKRGSLYLLLWACAASVASAQSLEINWFTIDGGGGASTGASYSLSGTIGQPDVGEMSGGNFSVTGGFWSLSAGPSGVLPTLFITPSGVDTILSWTPGAAGFVLQWNGGLSPTGWSDAPSGGTNPVVLPADGEARFYRLRKP
jgi:hypothetical protein